MDQILETLTETGKALYGTRWREPISRALHQPDADKPGINLRNLHSWLAGDRGRSAPSWIPEACMRLLRFQAYQLERLADDIESQYALGDRDLDQDACVW